MKYKIKLVIFLLIWLFLFQLTGCSLWKGNMNTKSVINDNYAIKQLPAAKITMYLPGFEPAGWKDVKQAIEKELQPTLNVKLDFHWVESGSLMYTINDQIESGKSLDAFIASKTSNKDDIEELFQDGKIMELSSLVEKEAPKLKDSISKEALENVTYTGKLAAIPPNFPKSNRICFVITEDTLKYAGIELHEIKNYDDINTFLESFNQIDFDRNTLELFGETAGYVNLGYGLVYAADDPDMKVIPWEKTDAFKAGVEMLSNWQRYGACQENLFYQGELAYPHRPVIELIDNYEESAYLTTYEEIQRYIHMYGRTDSPFKIIPLYPEISATISTDTSAVVISKCSKNADRVVKFLDWLYYSQENYDLFIYGIKGVHYDFDGNKIYFPKDGQRYFGWDGADAFFNSRYMREEETDPDGFKEEYTKEVTEQSKYPPTTGFVLNKSRIVKLLEKRQTDFNNFEIRLRSLEFKTTEEEIDEFIKQQEDNQIDWIVSDVQSQIKAWRSGK